MARPKTPDSTKSRPDYDRIAGNYDRTRPPVGIDAILGALSGATTPLADMCVLDAGCGTGNFSQALSRHVETVVGMDISPGMIARARQKVPANSGGSGVRLVIGPITHLPFRPSVFDGILANQVLHHLHDRPSAGFPVHRSVVHEFARVLKPGGVIVIGTSSQEQCLHGFWFYYLLTEAAERLRQKFAPLPLLADMLNGAGFRVLGQVAPKNVLLQGDAYFDTCGPLRKAWRDGDSAWALATPREIDRSLTTIKRLDEQGALNDQFKKWDTPRQRIGQVTYLIAVREAA